MSPTEYICQETLITPEVLAPLVERLFEQKHYKKTLKVKLLQLQLKSLNLKMK